jgi:hypothetical protein
MGGMLFQNGHRWDPIFYTSILLSPVSRIHWESSPKPLKICRGCGATVKPLPPLARGNPLAENLAAQASTLIEVIPERSSVV